jgi:DNA-binding transcriptional MocR family regulator
MKKVIKKTTSFSDKWSVLIEDRGYTQIPNLLIRHMGDLGITPLEYAVISGLLSHQWSEDNPYPSLTTVSSYIGRSRGTAQAAVRSLENKGFVIRILRGSNETNEYDFRPLVERLKSYAQPIEKSIPTHRKTDNISYRKVDTEEYFPNKTHLKRRSINSGKPTHIGVVLKNRSLP